MPEISAIVLLLLLRATQTAVTFVVILYLPVNKHTPNN